jgi:hypothetical protein
MVWGARYTLGARYLYIKRNVEKVWGARYLPENTVFIYLFFHPMPPQVHLGLRDLPPGFGQTVTVF